MKRITLDKIPALLTSSAVVMVAQSCSGGNCPGGWNGMMGGNYPSGRMGGWLGLGIVGSIISIVFWVAVIVALVYLIKYLMKKEVGARKDEPEEILRRRYAKGEITKEDYDRMRDELNKM
jgi:putative membrane protein